MTKRCPQYATLEERREAIIAVTKKLNEIRELSKSLDALPFNTVDARRSVDGAEWILWETLKEIVEQAQDEAVRQRVRMVL